MLFTNLLARQLTQVRWRQTARQTVHSAHSSLLSRRLTLELLIAFSVANKLGSLIFRGSTQNC